MTKIKQLGWLGILLAVFFFSLGFCAGAVYHHAIMPTAYSAIPKVVEVPTRQPPIPAAEFTKLAVEVSGIREELTQIKAALVRIEAALAKR